MRPRKSLWDFEPEVSKKQMASTETEAGLYFNNNE